MSNKVTQVTPTRNNIRNSKRRNKRNNRKENDKQENTVPPPPTAPNREWSDAKYHHVPGVPQPDSSNTAPVVISNNYSHNHVRHETSNPSNQCRCGWVYSRGKKKKEDKIEQRSTAKPLQGAAKPEVLYLYMTNCHTDTEEADIENHLLVNFPEMDDVNAFKTKIHSYNASFTVSLKGKALVADEFLKSDSFSSPVRVFLNRNKYKTSQPERDV